MKLNIRDGLIKWKHGTWEATWIYRNKPIYDSDSPPIISSDGVVLVMPIGKGNLVGSVALPTECLGKLYSNKDLDDIFFKGSIKAEKWIPGWVGEIWITASDFSSLLEDSEGIVRTYEFSASGLMPRIGWKKYSAKSKAKEAI